MQHPWWVRGFSSLALMIGGVVGGAVAEALAADGVPVYPKARRGDQVDDYHGLKVPDPYRWLEDSDSPETRAWIDAENKVTQAYLAQIPARDRIRERLTELWNYRRYGLPRKVGDRYFFTMNDGLQNQSVLYTVDSLEGTPRDLIDPNTWSEDGTVALHDWAPSEDGRLVAYSQSTGGSDWQEWRVRDVVAGQDLPDRIRWVKFSGASWTKDSKGFFYSRFDEPKDGDELQDTNYFQKLFYHRLGTAQSDDVLVYHRPDEKEWGFQADVTDDGRFLVITVTKGTLRKNQVFYKDVQKPEGNVVELISGFDAEYDFIDNDGPVFWFKTDLAAPLGRVVAVDTGRPDRAEWKEVIPQAMDALESVNLFGDVFIASYLKDAQSAVKLFSVDGRPVGELALPAIGSAGGFGGKRRDAETFFSFDSFTTPGTIYRYDIATRTSTVFRRPEVRFDPSAYTTEQVFYQSKDGTRVPMFISRKKGLQHDGRSPTLLYGYGGFNVPITPYFGVSKLLWMEMGGVFAVACIRGGGEYGQEWHEAGIKLHKQTVFDDFIAAAEWLIANQYTRPEKLAIQGGSNGGLLVGACMIQRPELFGAALPAVGVMDMLRFNKFTIGWAWTSDYGSPDNAEEFKALFAYSPLHNLKAGTAYPATFITTADHDDRVVPAHSFKFAAALQEAHSGSAPVLVRIETKAGHGAGKPTTMMIEEATDTLAFVARTLGMSGHGG